MILTEVRAAVDALYVTQQGIATIIADHSEDWRRRLVQQRRQLSEQIGAVATRLEAAALPSSVEPELQAVRSALSFMQTRLAHHQATWPAVSLEPDSAAYRGSVGPLREANSAFRERFAELEKQLATRPKD